MALWPAALAVKVVVASGVGLATIAGTAAATTGSDEHPPAVSPLQTQHVQSLGSTSTGSPFAPLRLPVHSDSKPSATHTLSKPPAPPAPKHKAAPRPKPRKAGAMRMFDSAEPSQIPSYAPAVAGYVTGPYAWHKSDWARFPHAKKVTIDILGGYTGAQVEDVEAGGVPVSAIHDWAVKRHHMGQMPVIYSSISDYQAVKPAMHGVKFVWWSAQPYTGPHIIPGSIGTQYYWGHGFDISKVSTNIFPKAVRQPAPKPKPVVHHARTVSEAPGAGLPPIFRNCIINAESSGNAQDPDGLYGILQSTWEQELHMSGTPGHASVAVQNHAALTLYHRYGLQPWYDPCTGRS